MFSVFTMLILETQELKPPVLNPWHLSLSPDGTVWHTGGGRPWREPDRAQPPGRPATLPDEWRGSAGDHQPSAHTGQSAVFQASGGHRAGPRHPLPCHVHRHRWARVRELKLGLFSFKYVKHLSHLVQSEYGTILKALATTNKTLHGCYLEELRILPEGQIRPIKSLQILHSDRSLFVGLDDRLVKIPLERCSNYPTERYNTYRPHACQIWCHHLASQEIFRC